MAAALQGAPLPKSEPLAAFAAADELRQYATATALGRTTSAAYNAWNASLPNDLGTPAVLTQPKDISRFAAATVTWRGGNNDVDQPRVRVERQVDGKWTSYADQSGEVQTVVAYPKGVQSVVKYRAGRQAWNWTANFEAADFFPSNIAGGQVPTGTYRFVIAGRHRRGGQSKAYSLVSRAFTVSAWDGVAVNGLRVEPNGTVSFATAVAYPRTYKSSIAAIGDDGGNPICKTCTFRAWASTSAVTKATVTVRRASGATFAATATLVNGRWTTAAKLKRGDTATVARGAVVDANGEFNGAAARVSA
jgi:hypothetical protein